MNVLVVHASKRGGTAEIAAWVAEALRERGIEVAVAAAGETASLPACDAVIVGGALYAGHWIDDARRFVVDHAEQLRARHVWFFSSGPLDEPSLAHEIPPTPDVAELLAHVGANGHVTFGGRLAPDARGFVAAAMAKTHAGDFRHRADVVAWAGELADRLAVEPRRAPRPASAFAPLPSAAALTALTVVAGLSAVFGGACLVARPDGSVLGLTPSLLSHAVFSELRVPGLLLAGIGAGSLASAVLHLRRSFVAPFASAIAGVALVVWALAEIAILRNLVPLQALCLLLGLMTAALSLRATRRTTPHPTARAQAAAS